MYQQKKDMWSRAGRGSAYRSMMEAKGATSDAAAEALATSAVRRRKRFLVFHCVSALLDLERARPAAAAPVGGDSSLSWETGGAGLL